MTPAPAMRRTLASQRTGAVDLPDEQLLHARGVGVGLRVEVRDDGERGGCTAIAPARAATTRAAGAISAQWKGALTLSGMTRPFSAAASSPDPRDGRARAPRRRSDPGR